MRGATTRAAAVDWSLRVVVEAGQPGGKPLDRHLELGVRVDEVCEPCSEPREGHRLLAAPGVELLDPAIGEVHDLERERGPDDLGLLVLMRRPRATRRGGRRVA
jgi:hypothetical protein